jgi:cell fate regulator YaaT (PSP1 superfamily)
MSSGAQRPFVSVKFSPVGRTYTFLLPELLADAPASSPDANSQQAAASGQQPDVSQEPAGSSEQAAGSPEREASSQHPAASTRSIAPLTPGDAVIVQTAEGRALGTVTRTVSELAARKSPPSNSELQVVRRATRDDVMTRLKHQHREQEAHRICLMKIRERGLAMKLTRVEQLFDGSRLIFYYTAEGRVDFRELVRDLAAHFRVRIEMRQIGVRDEARMLGGYGSCGRPLCCTTFLQTFEPISIKMAKQQNLSLNPSKLSGMCGRLKCCLRYELPNGKGVKHGGCADEGGCGSCSNPTGPGGGGGCGSCGSGGCGKCG